MLTDDVRGYAFTSVCFVCLSVCSNAQEVTNGFLWNFLSGWRPKTSWLGFGGNADHEQDPRFHHLDLSLLDADHFLKDVGCGKGIEFGGDVDHDPVDLRFLDPQFKDSLFTLAVLIEAKNKTLKLLAEVWTLMSAFYYCCYYCCCCCWWRWWWWWC